LRSYVPKEQELGTIKKEIGTMENQTFQIIRDPVEVQELAFKLAWSSENEILGLFPCQMLSTDKYAWVYFRSYSN
jgi:hypothetical protein